MRVLVGCEFSGVVRDAFIRAGHKAVSCDLLPTEAPGPHYQGDVEDLLIPGIWDLIIMHPDCTHVCNAGNRHYGEGTPGWPKRVASAKLVKRWWTKCRLASKRICFENPPGVLPDMARLPMPYYVQPWMFGHMEQKRTGLYLRGLPPLQTTHDVYDEMMELPRHKREAVFYMGPSETRWMDRARTYTGIAEAMAQQWGNL